MALFITIIKTAQIYHVEKLELSHLPSGRGPSLMLCIFPALGILPFSLEIFGVPLKAWGLCAHTPGSAFIQNKKTFLDLVISEETLKAETLEKQNVNTPLGVKNKK